MLSGAAPYGLLQMLMDIVWIGVIGTGTRAKAAAFMYSEVVAPTASSRHDRIPDTLPASAAGRGAPAVRFWPSAAARCLAIWGGKMFSPRCSVGTDQVTVSLGLSLSDPELGRTVAGEAVAVVYVESQLRYPNKNTNMLSKRSTRPR